MEGQIELRDIKESALFLSESGSEYGSLWIWAGVLLALVILGVGGFLYYRRKLKKSPKLPTPEELWLDSLKSLAQSELSSDQWSVALSLSLRSYLSHRVGFDLRPLTSDEMDLRLGSLSTVLGQARAEELCIFLRGLDQSSFAGLALSDVEKHAALDRAQSIARSPLGV